jgi:uncharacterized membrane protein YtjA (UPF0391 family)
MSRLQQVPCPFLPSSAITTDDEHVRHSTSYRIAANVTSGDRGQTRAGLGMEFAQASGASTQTIEESSVMLSWALAFFIIAIIAAVFGFTGIAAGAAEIAKILFVVFVVLFLVSLVAGLLRRP